MDTSTTHAGQTVLLLGATGRTGGRVLEQLLSRGVSVRALVRSAARLPAGVAHDPRLTVVEADLLSLSAEQVREQVKGCDLVISCLGHTISLRGVFGPPRDLVTRSVERVYRASRELRPAQPVRLILMSSVAVNRHGGLDARRGRFERAVLWTAARPRPSGEGQPARRGLPPGRRRGRRSARAVGGRPSRHAEGG